MSSINDWRPIATAPRRGGRGILLRNATHRRVKALWTWNRETQRWEAPTATPRGCAVVWWSDDLEPPTEWRAP